MGQGRLFKIVYHLLDKGRATAPELAEKFEVSVRTIYRDLDAISAAGIPIYTVQGKGGGIFILPEFVLEKSLLTPQEKEQILMALQGLAAAEDSRTDELITKLGGLFRVQGANWIEVDFSDWHKNTAGAELFDELKRAVFSCRRVSFSYFAGEGGGTVRTVEPVKLIFKSIYLRFVFGRDTGINYDSLGYPIYFVHSFSSFATVNFERSTISA